MRSSDTKSRFEPKTSEWEQIAGKHGSLKYFCDIEKYVDKRYKRRYI